METGYRPPPKRSRRSSFSALCAGLVFLGLLLGTATAARATCLLRVGWDEWPPYLTRENGVFRGSEYELLRSTADVAGCEIEMRQVPWARALLMLKDNKLDLLYGAGYSAERAGYARFSAPYRQEKFVLVVNATVGGDGASIALADWIRTGSRGGEPPALGVFRGNFYGDKIDGILKENAARVAISAVSKNEQMVEMLRLGRLDGFIVEESVALMLMRESAFPMRKFVIEEQVADPLHYMFASEIPENVIARFNAAIKARQAAGR